jgi:glycerol uptake facilitator-like aquaporin
MTSQPQHQLQVPSYAVAQVLGSTLASLTLRVVFGGATAREHFFGTAPSGSDAQAVALEFVISFYLMFVVSGVATDNRAVTTDITVDPSVSVRSTELMLWRSCSRRSGN